jgi:cytochrome b involved in lipid metabolism
MYRKPSDKTPRKQERQFTWEEIKGHNTHESCWLVVRNKVYDVTKFLHMHPAGMFWKCDRFV